MAGLSVSLYTALQTLQNTQTEIQTASNNISNAATTGYAEETAVQTENPAVLTTSGWLGTGATISRITSARNQFLEQQLMSAMSDDSQYSSLSTQLTAIQSACADSGDDGISQALGNFFSAWSTLPQDPTGLTGQTAVYSAAQNLASAVQSTYNQLNQIATQMPGQIENTVNQANALIAQIAQLNTSIAQSQTPTGQANQLSDQRYQAMDSLAQLIPVSFSQDPATGMVTVTTTDASGSLRVVSGGTATPLPTSLASPITSTITGGQLGGLLTAQTDLNGYIGQLNTFTSTLMSQVNNISEGSEGNPPNPALAVFSAVSGSEASSITASTTFMGGLTAAELSSSAQAIADLQNSQVTFTDGTNVTNATPEQYLSNIQQNVGDDVQQANNNQSFYDALKTQLQTQQQSVSGVSTDQEMVNVIQDQQVYEEAAKVVETVSSLMSDVISMVT
ncbi:MAG: flagellar hook-associated protein FlgK [Syntrophobacteraceae bacterium]|jgi:flagellar hook-associated protein 1 FlgK